MLPKNPTIILDMDGLLLDTEGIAHPAWVRACKDFGHELTDEVFNSMVGRKIDISKGLLLEEFGDDFPIEKAHAKRIEYGNQHIEEHGINLKPGVIELLDCLVEKSIPYCIATSTARELAIERLKIAGIFDRFSLMIAGDEVKNGKPHPEIFLKAAELLSLIHISEPTRPY